jgi:hypothetical protein
MLTVDDLKRGDMMKGLIKGFLLAGFLGVFAFPSSVWADSITIEAHPATFPESLAGPSRVDFSFHVAREAAAFAGVTIKAGATATCAVNYAQELLSPGSSTVATDEQSNGELTSNLDGGTGEIATVPGGSWTLCGWVQPEGNTSTAVPSAVSDPMKFTVGGPVGTTSLSVLSTVPAGGALTATVQYATQELSGEMPGTTTASLYISASRGSAGCASPETSFQQLLVDVETQQVSVPVVAGQPGTATFGVTLPLGAYSLCAYMLQTFPFVDNTPEIRVPAFGTSAVTTTVLAAPQTASPLITSSPGVRSESMRRSCTTVRGTDMVAVVTETGSSCAVAHKIVLKLIRKIGAMGAHSSRSDRIVKVTASGDSFVCHVRDPMAAQYSAACDRGHAVVNAKVTSHEMIGRRK